ncbi:hypothetical protein C8R43DRAFT_955890 [Mycena crocata]|nr:hypothetical protein C8R43DRAFT_955890 [Mycena crocata]
MMSKFCLLLRVVLSLVILCTNGNFMGRGIDLGENWPPPDAGERLVKMSSGTFIYATTVIRFIDDEYYHPSERLEAVLNLDPRRIRKINSFICYISSGKLPRLTSFWIPKKSIYFWNYGMGMAGGSWTTPHATSPHDPATDKVSVFLLANRDIVGQLPRLLEKAAPSDALIDLLRNPHVQKGLFLYEARRWRHGEAGEPRHQWPETESRWPSDLIQLWEDQRAITALIPYLHISKNPSAATYEYDAMYTELFSRNPDLLLVLQCTLLEPDRIRSHLHLWGWTEHILRPLLAVGGGIQRQGFPEGDSPADFLTGQSRARHLYSRPCDVAEKIVLRSISGLRRTLAGGPAQLDA